MAAARSSLPLITPAPQVPHDLLYKRAQVTCGDLRSAYSNVKAPVCSGWTSICTFTNGLQGCCDSSGSCQFYTNCIGGYADATCSGSRCLTCPRATPYCIKYSFQDSSGQGVYEGHSCGGLQIDNLTIYGIATSIGSMATMSVSSPTATSSSASTSSDTMSLRSSTQSPTSTATESPSDHHLTKSGVVAVGVVGGLAALVLVAGATWWYKKHYARKSRQQQYTGLEIQQNYREGDTPRLLP